MGRPTILFDWKHLQFVPSIIPCIADFQLEQLDFGVLPLLQAQQSFVLGFRAHQFRLDCGVRLRQLLDVLPLTLVLMRQLLYLLSFQQQLILQLSELYGTHPGLSLLVEQQVSQALDLVGIRRQLSFELFQFREFERALQVLYFGLFKSDIALQLFYSLSEVCILLDQRLLLLLLRLLLMARD